MIVSLYLRVMRFILGIIADQNVLTAFIVMGSIIIIGSVLFRINKRDVKIMPTPSPH